MAGTDTRRGQLPEDALPGPAVILIEPQMGENIGATARAMLNCGLTDLRLVRPRDGWPNSRAVASSSGATLVIDNVKLFETTEDAIADLQFVFATTARARDMIMPVYTPRAAAAEIHQRMDNPAKGTSGQDGPAQKCGVLFGPERSGLVNDDISRADAVINVPLNPGFSSLNLGQAVLLIAYEWSQGADETPPRALQTGETGPVSKQEFDVFITRLEEELDKGGFFTSPDMRPTILRNLRNLFQRMEVTSQEIRTLHGVVTALTGGKTKKQKSG